ncbi:MAG TPA: DUF2497 domain-containing protein [Geminicoccaceae bacterium]|nr:DUF2497 domain-containing protein [Geminicoccaceae bacterium]
MSQPKEQQEPSMEEILSSIRRIIADEAGDQEGEQDAVGTQPEPADWAEAPGFGGGDADDDVLELTEVVREEGEVIDLDRSLAQAHALERQPDGEPEAFPAEPDAVEPAGDEPVALRRDAGLTARAFGDEDAAPSITDIRGDEMEDQQTVTQQKKNGFEPLVSDRAAGAATGALAKLSQAVQRTPAELSIADSGRSVEQFVEDMMRPMLREWLDENLPALVERIVQREIKKIVRRAAEDD